jgi:nitrogen fixation NifU-like protein
MYTDKVMEEFTNPKNVGEIPDADAVGEVGNATCGDIMKIYMKIENDIITDIKFRTFGCGAAIATSSMATQMVLGKTVEEAMNLTNKQVMDELGGLPPAKVHCSLLAEEAISAALKNYFEKQGKEVPEKLKNKCDGHCETCHKHG